MLSPCVVLGRFHGKKFTPDVVKKRAGLAQSPVDLSRFRVANAHPGLVLAAERDLTTRIAIG
jgi:hypothetical protein